MGPGREGFSVRPADLLTCKQEGRPIAALTAWDALSAALVEQAGADLILVGDSLAMVVLGHTTTLPAHLRRRAWPAASECSATADRDRSTLPQLPVRG
jgi:3-methyl-2-oxobutanoate hydroxymethyltransferase